MSAPQSRLTVATGRRAELFRNLANGRVQCVACARRCQVGEGQVGLCGVRGVVGGELYLLNYGKIITGNIDPIEKKPVMHYRPGSKIFSIATTGCSWLCHPAGTKILLSNGKTKNVEDVAPGESLWSYEIENGMAIYPDIVTHTGTRTADVWEVSYGNHSHGKLRLTAEHPVFTSRGWKKTSELQKGDEILRVWSRITESGIKRQKAAIATRPLESSEQRLLADPNHGWYRDVERVRDRLHAHPSKSRELLYGILDEAGVRYEKEYRISVASPEPPAKFYIADAAILPAKLDIEVDDWRDYNNEEWKASDITGEQVLKARGWDVLRISGSHVYNHPEEVKRLILERLAKPEMLNIRVWVEVEKIERLESAPVYGLETIPDHNYVADGIVVHNCRYCQNYDISQRRKTEGIDMAPKGVVELALQNGCEGIAYTYNEPSIFIEYARDVGRLAHEKGIFNVFVSNGFETPEAVSVMGEFLDCLTVDFKGSGETEFVRKYIGVPNADPVFQTLLEVKQRTKVHVEVTDLVVPKVGDDLESARKLARWVYDSLGPDTPIHFLRFHPDYKMMDIPVTPVGTLEKHVKVAKKEGLRYVYIGNVPGHPAENTYCPGCGKVLIERGGYELGAYNLDGANRCRFCGYQTPVRGPLSASAHEDRFKLVVG